VKVVWTTAAKQDRAAILDYIAADSPSAAARMNRLFREAATRLGEQPKMGRKGKLPDTRELIPHKSYRLVYEIGEDAVRVLMLVHTARQWPHAVSQA
jgi:addiction module RelE/StbE family toxin